MTRVIRQLSIIWENTVINKKSWSENRALGPPHFVITPAARFSDTEPENADLAQKTRLSTKNKNNFT